MTVQCLSLHSLCFLFLCSRVPQEVIDIFEGVRDDQALRMAANLGFKGPLERQVIGPTMLSEPQCREAESRTHTPKTHNTELRADKTG